MSKQWTRTLSNRIQPMMRYYTPNMPPGMDCVNVCNLAGMEYCRPNRALWRLSARPNQGITNRLPGDSSHQLIIWAIIAGMTPWSPPNW